MHGLSFIVPMAVALTQIVGTNAWLVDFWEKTRCSRGAGDTARGGEPGQENKCSMLGFTDVKAIKITDWEEGCKVALYNDDTIDCSGEPVWEKTKEEAAEAGELVDDNWSCQVRGIAGKGVSYVSYTCE